MSKNGVSLAEQEALPDQSDGLTGALGFLFRSRPAAVD
jgi:hypothetical protein